MSEHGRLRTALGAYALGALDHPERAEVDAHLEVCAACRDELARLAVLPGLLARLTPEEAAEGVVVPTDDLAARAVAAAAAASRRQRRVLRLWQTAAALALVAMVALGVPWRAAGDRLPVQPVTAQVTGTVTAEGRPWGTAVRLDVVGLPPADAYALWAVARDGRRQPAAWWGPTPQGTARLTGACALARDDLDRLEVTDADGSVLAVADAD